MQTCPGVDEAAEDDGARGALEIAVGAGDERSFSAELDDGRDEIRAARSGDLPARRDAAREHELLDATLDEGLPDVAAAVCDLEEVLRQARGIVDRLRFLHRERSHLARLHDDRASRDERREDVAHGDDERKVPRRDDPDHTARDAEERAPLVPEQVERHLARCENSLGVLAVVGELIDRDHHLVTERIGRGLPAFLADHVDDLLGAFHECVAEAEETCRALRDRDVPPGRLRAPGPRDCGRDVFLRRDRHLAEKLTGRGRPALQGRHRQLRSMSSIL